VRSLSASLQRGVTAEWAAASGLRGYMPTCSDLAFTPLRSYFGKYVQAENRDREEQKLQHSGTAVRRNAKNSFYPVHIHS
jgi:hypothetical protein